MDFHTLAAVAAPGFAAAVNVSVLAVAIRKLNRIRRAVNAGDIWTPMWLGLFAAALSQTSLAVFADMSRVAGPGWQSATIESGWQWYLATSTLTMMVSAVALAGLACAAAAGWFRALSRWVAGPSTYDGWQSVPNGVRLRRQWRVDRLSSRILSLVTAQVPTADRQAGGGVAHAQIVEPTQAATLYRLDLPHTTRAGLDRAVVLQRVAAELDTLVRQDLAVAAVTVVDFGATATSTDWLRVQWNLDVIGRPLGIPARDWDPALQRRIVDSRPIVALPRSWRRRNSASLSASGARQ